MPPVVAAAGIAAGASLLGGVINSKAAKGASKSQSDMAKLALDEQKRIYENEDKKDRERYQTDRDDLKYERAKTMADESRVLASRQNAFGGFGGDLSTFSKGYAPVLGMSAEQTSGLLDARNAGFSQGGGRVPMPPQMGDRGSQPSLMPETARPGSSMPGTMPGQGGPLLPGPSNGSMGSTVWLKAPTGEEMEVPIDQAMPMLQQGAQLIAGPTGGQ